MDPEKQTFTIQFQVDFEPMADARDFLDAELRNRWVKAAKESGREFLDELHDFIQNHPFVSACKIEDNSHRSHGEADDGRES